jgi:uncharacterized damage-inducible protein DinB
MSANAFLSQLQSQTLELRQIVSKWSELSAEILAKQPAPGSWSIAQCLDHLNGYGDFYLPHLEKALNRIERGPVPAFRSGWLGNYFADSMEPRPDGKPKSKMKAFKNHVPAADPDVENAVGTFLRQQDTLLRLMERAHTVNLNPRVVPMSIAGWITLKTGDVFRFIIAHNRRHIAQAKRALAAAGVPESPALNEAI